MKKSKYIQLVLITAALAACNKQDDDWQNSNNGSNVYVRSDTTAPYTRAHFPLGAMALWYYAFRPMGHFNNGVYQRAGYHSRAIHPQSNFGSNAAKGAIARGGFGRGSATVSS